MIQRRSRLFVAAAALPLFLVGCGDSVAQLGYELRRTLPHDPSGYTQGLLIHDGVFFESTGQYGESDVRRVDIATGEVLLSHALADEYFGEGIALVGDKLIQLTWKAGLAFVYDAATLVPEGTFAYEGEGWGLCHDGRSLFMSDGSGTLQRRDPATFELLDLIEVTNSGFSVRNLNELECVGDHIYANIYMRDEIVRVDKSTGEVTGMLDAFALSLSSGRPADAGAVFNGIAYDDATGTFYVTGKLWASMFEIAITEE
jgi:glutamine cyclotransferase